MTATSSCRLWISAAWVAASTLGIAAGCQDNDNDHADASINPPIDAPTVSRVATVTRNELVSDITAPGVTTDPNLVNPWGMAFNATGQIWVADNGKGVATVYGSGGAIVPLVVTLPVPSGVTGPAAPTGQVFNGTSDFMGDRFIMVTEEGTILGWQSGTSAVIRSDKSSTGAVYKGVAIVDTGTGAGRQLLAANFSKNRIDVFDSNFNLLPVSSGQYIDPAPISNAGPFNIFVAGSNVYVAYALQDAAKKDDVPGAGNGVVDVYDNTGRFVKRLITGGTLNSPWGMAIAPSDYPNIGGDLIVGNFGDGHLGVFNPNNGNFVTQFKNDQNNPLVIPGLWSVVFGTDQPGASHLQIFFTSGPGNQTHGVLGRLDIAP